MFIESLNALLVILHQIDFGYPLGDNSVRLPLGNRSKWPSISEQSQLGLSDFYAHCDGLSLPDVRNGYFIKSLDRINLDTSEPFQIEGFMKTDIVTVGSNGGGQRFALDKNSGRMILLGNGLVQGGTFHSNSTNVKFIAENWSEFLEKILADVDAFVNDKQNHIYIA